jgi:hypothetical protein
VPSQTSFPPIHDTRVISTTPAGNYGTTTVLRVRSVDPTYHSYFKFDLSGISGPVQSARLRLFCNDASVDGGETYLVSNNYLGTSTPWTESGLTWNNAPAISGTPLAERGAVLANTWVEFDVTAAITGSGIYSFGMTSGSTNIAGYNSKESATNRPELVIDASGGGTPGPQISSFNPTSGPVGTEVTITGSGFTATTAVRFNGVAATQFTIDSNTQIRATVPTGATSGPIAVVSGAGTGTSAASFTVQAPPAIAGFTPANGAVGTQVTITGTGFAAATAVDFNGHAATFSIDSGTQIRTTVPAGATSGRIHVANPFGTATSTTDFTVTTSPPQPTVTFTPAHDTRVISSTPTVTAGTITVLRVRSETSNPVYRTYLKFNVAGVSGPILNAKLRLFCNDDAPDGGRVYAVSNNYSGTTTPWLESGLHWNNAPPLAGSVLAQKGAVSLNTWAEFDVTSAVTGNGTFSFGLNSNSSNIAGYSSKEGASPPQLVLSVGSAPALARGVADAAGVEAKTIGEPALRSIVPNPFKDRTTLRIELPRQERVRLVVYDVQGRRVRTLIDGLIGAGAHELAWDSRNEDGGRVEAGIYLVQLDAARATIRRKVVFVP